MLLKTEREGNKFWSLKAGCAEFESLLKFKLDAKGALFENLMIMELLKARLNEGAEDNQYFWRDKRGNEIDLLADDAGRLQIYEMKSAETISSDFFAGLDYFTKLHSDVEERLLVYGGKQMQTRSNGIRVTPWNEL